MLKSLFVLCLSLGFVLGSVTPGCSKKDVKKDVKKDAQKHAQKHAQKDVKKEIDWVKRVSAFASKACSCDNKDCMDEANKSLAAFVTEGRGVKIGKDDVKKINVAVKKGVVCLSALQAKLRQAKARPASKK